MTSRASTDHAASAVKPVKPVEPVEPDAHGQAAMLLAEAILHALVGKGIFTTREAIAVVEGTIDVKIEVATLAHESDARMRQSLALLQAIANSLAADLI